MRLTRISASNWMAYENLYLDFSSLSQVAVTGLNNHGKSAILDALIWCLYGRTGRDLDQRSADALVRRGEQDMWVRVEFATRAGDVVVTREKSVGKAATLSLVVNDEEKKRHTIAETEDAIVRLVGLDLDALLMGPFMVQEQSSLFMRAQPRERKDVLMRLLGLDEYERLWRIAKDKQSEAGAVRAALESAITGHEEEAALLPQVQEETERLRGEWQTATDARDLARQTVLDLTTDIGEERRHAEQLQGNLEMGKRARLEGSRIATRLDVLSSSRTQWDAVMAIEWVEPPIQLAPDPQEVAAAEQAATGAGEAVVQYERANGLVGTLSERLRFIHDQRLNLSTVPCKGEGIYSACPFLVAMPSAFDVQEVVFALRDAEGSAQMWQEQAAQFATLTANNRAIISQQHAAEIRDLEAANARLNYDTARSNAEEALAAIDAEVAELKLRAVSVTGEVAVYDGLQQALDDVVRRGVALRERLEAAKALEERSSRTVVLVEPRYRSFEKQLAVLEHAEESAKRLSVARDEERAREVTFGLLAGAWHRDGIPTTIIEMALPMIEERTNEVLSRLPEDLSIALRTQRPVNKGKGMAETLDVIVTIDGWESDYGLLSVGARFRVDLALRIALGQVIGQRGGGLVETLWLDEPLAALDAPGREAAVSTLNALSSEFGLVVVVSHHPDFNDAFPARVVVTKEAGISMAEVLT